MGDSTARMGLSPFQRVSGPFLLHHVEFINEDLEDLESVLAVSSPSPKQRTQQSG